MEINWHMIGLVVGLAFYGGIAVWKMRKPLMAAMEQIRALPRFAQVVLAVLAVVATVEAQKRGTGADDRLNAVRPSNLHQSNLQQMGTREASFRTGLRTGNGVPTVTAEDIARGYRLVSEETETGHSFAMPSNAVYVGGVHLHGGRSDFGRHVVDLDSGTAGWAFPYGPNAESSASVFWWFMDGRLQDALRDPAFAVSAGLGDVFAMQGESRLWLLADGETRTVTWERFFAGGDTNAPVNAQIVLNANGDFTVRSNDLVRVYRRIDPCDWDGDGLDNTIDGSPAASDGDCFGTGIDWLNANCGGVLSAVPGNDGGYSIVWNADANESAYYWLYFTATHNGTRVTITCDGASDLGDLVIIANEGQECAVPLLIGARYAVEASWPVSDIYASDPEAEIVDRSNTVRPSNLRASNLRMGSGGDIGPSDGFEVERPIGLGIENDGGGQRFSSDPDVGAVIGSISGSCCDVDTDGTNIVWNCGGGCTCGGGGHTVEVSAEWEGYEKAFWWSMTCMCSGVPDDDGPEYEVSASSVVVLGGGLGSGSASYVPAGDSEGMVTLSVASGSDKVALWSDTNRTEGVSLPMTWSADESRSVSFFIEGVNESASVDDVSFRLEVNLQDGTSETQTVHATVAALDRLDMSCAYAGSSGDPPPFDALVEYPVSVTNSASPGRHLVVPFHVVANADRSVRDFAVDMALVLRPEGASAAGIEASWEVVEATPQMSGTLQGSGATARFENPKRGGVYRFRARCGASAWAEGNVILPLAGAEVSGVVAGDLADVQRWVRHLDATTGPVERQTPWWGLENFYDFGMGDYRGRPDNAGSRTVWKYNAVNDSSGRGAVATLDGAPVRMAKLSNLMVAYATESMGVLGMFQWLAQAKGTWNDDSAGESWDAGEAIAGGAGVAETLSSMASVVWAAAPDGSKEKILWPNIPAADNHSSTTNSVDYNLFFRSPGIVERGRAMTGN